VKSEIRESHGQGKYYPPEFWTEEPSPPLVTLRELVIGAVVVGVVGGIAALWMCL
jgi:hypothetical protein